VQSFSRLTQFAGIDGSTLRVLDRHHNDRADSFALAVCVRARALRIAASTAGNGFGPLQLTEGWQGFGAEIAGWPGDGRTGALGYDAEGHGYWGR
jgi:hypothetical protein